MIPGEQPIRSHFALPAVANHATLPLAHSLIVYPIKGDTMPFDRSTGEDQLALDEIQGDILVGLQKDWQTFISFSIGDKSDFRTFVRHLAPDVTTGRTAFERELQIGAQKASGQKTKLSFIGIGIGFTFAGLEELDIPDLAAITDKAFKAGLAARSAGLGDPTSGPGSPDAWKIGGRPGLHGLLIVTGPDRERVSRKVAELKTRAGAGWTILLEEDGKTRKLDRGHEHFGFLDGVSQPAIRGQIDQLFWDHKFLQESRNPKDPGQGLPGADLHWPGEFVFGYPAQSKKNIDDRGPVAEGGLPWMKNGSFMVFRRLSQLVPEFEKFVDDTATAGGVDPQLLAARMVGRWKSGAPVSLSPLQDNPDQGANELANNDFEFGDDGAGRRCPYAAHIRKAYPRNDITPAAAGKATEFEQREASETDTQRHRLLRRGIPFGDDVSDAEQEQEATIDDRGLMFLSYQTSIDRQFEFIIKKWVNEANFAVAGAGFDPLLGQVPGGRARARDFTGATINYPTGATGPAITLPTDFIVPTGGGYFFAPSIHALKQVIGASPPAAAPPGTAGTGKGPTHSPSP